MPKIQILPEEIRSKIAAGEVVERPASVVKELIENSFDAGARFIKVSLKDGGKREVSVYDDGEGMEPEDLKLCYHHHATSKVKDLKDIFRIVTFGFRGEALASIAKVSKLTIISRAQGSPEAYELKVEYGKEISFKPVGFSKGTLVKVEDLFANLPARRSFLKSARTETLKIVELVKGLMLCKPELKYEVRSGEKTLILWGGGSLKELISYITGLPSEKFLELYSEKNPYSFNLVLTDTSQTFSHTRYLYILINNRLVKDEKLNRIVLSALKPFFGNLGFPAGVISFYIPYHLVDVNVHPAKWEVRLKNEKEVFEILLKALENLFRKKSFYFSGKSSFKEKDKVKEDLPVEYVSFSESSSGPFEGKSLEKGETPFQFQKGFQKKDALFKKESFKFFGAYLNTYLLVEKDEELYIIDQHALSERLIYEKLKAQDSELFSQELLFPVLLRVSETALLNLEEKLEKLKILGIEIEKVGENELILKKLPPVFKEDVKEVVEKLLEEEFQDVESLKDELLKRYACISARKKGDILPKEEVNFLIEEMFKKNVHTCPHGRPLYFKLTPYEVEMRLKRKL